MNCEVKGKITAVLGVKNGVSNGKDWEVREYVITEQSQYGKSMKFSTFSADGPISEPLSLNDDVTVSFNVSAREYKGNWYNDVRAWKIVRS